MHCASQLMGNRISRAVVSTVGCAELTCAGTNVALLYFIVRAAQGGFDGKGGRKLCDDASIDTQPSPSRFCVAVATYESRCASAVFYCPVFPSLALSLYHSIRGGDDDEGEPTIKGQPVFHPGLVLVWLR